MHPSRRKGISAEREVAGLFSDELGYTVKRNYNLGSHEDIGDVTAPNLTVQVANRKDIAQTVRHKPLEVERQRENAGTDFACTFVRLHGGDWRVVLTTEQFFALYREAAA